MSDKKTVKPKKKPHLSVVAESFAQLRKWERAAEKRKRSLSSWVRLGLDQIAKTDLGSVE